MNLRLFLAVLFCVSGTFYNTESNVLRIILMLTWVLSPILASFSVQKIIPFNLNGDIRNFLFSVLIFISLSLSMIYTLDTFRFGFSGSQIERFTPVFFLFHSVALMAFSGLLVGKKADNFIVFIFSVIIVVALVDLFYRYIQSPSLFLDYNHRQSAKNLSFFKNTNIVGQFLAFFFILSFSFRYTIFFWYRFLLFILLICTMNRSAIIASVLVLLLLFFFKSKKSIFLLLFALIIIFSLATGLWATVNTDLILKDGSFLSKIAFLQVGLNLLQNANIGNVLLGFGGSVEAVTEVLNTDGHSPHVAIVKSFLYYGFLGVCCYFTMLLSMLLYNRKFFFPLITYVIFSLSGGPIFWPTLSVGMLLLMIYANGKVGRFND